MMAADAPAIRLEHVSKSFEARKVLDDVSIDIAQGTAFCILGRSGTGKSVTLKHIIGLLKPDQGTVWVEGKAINTLSARDLSQARKRMGFLFQGSALFDSITVGENVAFPLRRHTSMSDSEVRESAREKLARGLESTARCRRAVGRHAQRGARAGDGARSGDPPGGRAEFGARSDDRGRIDDLLNQQKASKDHAGDGDPQRLSARAT